MITGHVFIATSLDGFVARAEHQLDWLMKFDTSNEDHGFDAFMQSVDGLVMGRKTFDTVLTFGEWPYTKPVVVMSRTSGDVDVPNDLHGKVRFSALDPKGTMDMLEVEGWSKVYVDGGQLVQSFLRAGLISELSLTRVPVLIGDGLPLFGPLDRDLDLEHLDTKTFPSGLVTSRYRILNESL